MRAAFSLLAPSRRSASYCSSSLTLGPWSLAMASPLVVRTYGLPGGRRGHPDTMPEERLVSFRTQSILRVVALLLALGAVLWILYVSRQVLSWVFVSLFLALALNPAVEWLVHRRAIKRRGVAAAVIYLVAIAAFTGLGFLL